MGRLRVPVAVRWSDMDAFGHVNNVQFLRLMEEVRIRAFEELRGGGPSLLETGVLVARHEVEYLQPMRWRPEPVLVDLWVTRVGGASFDLGYEVADDAGRDGARAVYLRAASTMVTFDVATGSTRRVSEAERAVLQGWLGDPVPFRRRRA
ncbi:thioesterase family protein [Quadrisphaera sp. DSM 44207]|uniref:acyl-CoA thioesterase n=1 Tax=Quadrisphaera sp. DSM 44207 TaxID=1881057 RepID=UPI0008872127|nr:acyl-CoA thioesterase [Quadrisphaera sp. DSM 44207]SDQ06367.1 acyl-CoA thioester hydrolase [Quadrisphaera sp. DSM 44207]